MNLPFIKKPWLCFVDKKTARARELWCEWCGGAVPQLKSGLIFLNQRPLSARVVHYLLNYFLSVSSEVLPVLVRYRRCISEKDFCLGPRQKCLGKVFLTRGRNGSRWGTKNIFLTSVLEFVS